MKLSLLLSTLLCLLAANLLAQTPTPAKEDDKKDDAAKTEEKKPEKKVFWLHIKNVDVHPVVGAPLFGAEILCSDGKIVAIGRDLEAPRKDDEKLEYEVLDGQGLRAYPGLIALNGGNLIPPMTGKPGDNTDPRGILTKMSLAHGITTTVSGTTAVKLDANATNDAVLRGGLFIGMQYSSRNPAQKSRLREDLEKARDFIRATKSGVDDKEKAEKQKALGSANAYIPLLEGKQIAVFNVSDRQSIIETCGLIEHFGFRAVLRGADEGWTVPGHMGRAGVSAILTPRERNDPDETVNRESGGTMSNAKILWEHGVPVAFATGAANIEFDAQPGRDALSVTWEAGAAISGGLPEDAALRGITLVAARVYGLDDRIGSLEVGKDADIVICDGEILHYNTMVQWAIVNGRLSYEKSKENLFKHIRPIAGEDPEKGRNWWPRPLAEMPDDWAYDAMAEAKKKLKLAEAAKAAETPASQPAESQPAESKPAESQPAESQPAESQPAASQPAESQPAESAPSSGQ